MSFGSAAQFGIRRPADQDPCVCGNGNTYGRCCGPLHRGEAAPSPERLMRSRYSAFALGDARYLADTWHPRTRPERIDIDPDVRWVGLRIIDAPAVGRDTTGIVEFRARWRHGADSGEQHERSRFRLARGRWWYLDAETAGSDIL
ncbi:YchJ family metal-binding protein [Microbacterium sp.]|uniref:YchJ family protein n=1 Tax=Microbacterium sp. TaxID=51671 RepID=UPI002627B606|nr:YchJ family metal-binding protein [Microbacterium sp.]